MTPTAVKASASIEDITYTAKLGGEPGNNITVALTAGGTAGAEVVTVVGNAISIKIQSGTSTATQVSTAIGASDAALALITSVITGSPSGAQSSHSAVNLSGGLNEFTTARFTSEKYSGTPTTTESAQIRTDRMSSGQVVTGLTVAGGHNFELAKELALEDFLESAMFNTWTSADKQTRTLAVDADAQTITASTGSFLDEGLVVGDMIILSGFTSGGNNTEVMVTGVTDLVLDYAGPTGMATSSAGTPAYQRADKLSVGITPQSLTIEKTFLDLDQKAIIYRGCLVSQLELNVAYGSLISGSFDTSGNDYVTVDDDTDFVSFGEYIDVPATTSTLNGSVDMPFITTDVTGDFEENTFCIQSVKLTLSNNLSVQNCIGRAAPENYTPGTAQVKVDISSYLKDANWPLLARKLSQEPFALGFQVKNIDGWYAFFMPAIQVSFDDPASGGQNQDISLDMSGTAKVGATGESELSIFRLPS